MDWLFLILSENSEMNYKQIQILQQWFWVLLVCFMSILILTIFLLLFFGIPIFRNFNEFKRKRSEGRLDEFFKPTKAKEKPVELDRRTLKKQEKMKEKSALYSAIISLNEEYVELQGDHSPIYTEEITFYDYEAWMSYQAIDYVRAHKEMIQEKIDQRARLLEIYNAYSTRLDRLLEEHKEVSEEEKAFCLTFVLPLPDLSPLFFRVKATCIGNKENESKSLVISELNARKMIALVRGEA